MFPFRLLPQSQSAPKSSRKTILLQGKYEMGRRLGSGSFAKVHVARSMETDELVAIKIIDKRKTIRAGMESRIIGEIEAMKRVQDHPNVIKIYEVMATKSKIYLIMELAVGGELLTKLIQSGRLNESAARRYFQQVASALSFCHRDGIAHRDIKPQNLLLDNQGNLKVSDFGLSALPEQRCMEGLLHTACGTPAYTAPEVIRKRGYDGAKADAWSCGVLLFALLAGYVPFNDSNLALMYRKIYRREIRFPSWISKPARSIIYKLLDPNPHTRMSLEAVIQTTWFKRSLETTEIQPSVLEPELKSWSDTITAFDLIALSSGLDLSGMFGERKRKEKRFTAKVSVEEVVEKAERIGEKLGFRVEKNNESKMVRLGKGRTMVVVEAGEVVQGLVVAEVKVTEGKEEEEEAHWSELIVEFDEEIVFAWHNDFI